MRTHGSGHRPTPAELPSIRGHRNDVGRGVLNAMKAGMAASAGEYVLITMSDGSDEPQSWARCWSWPVAARTSCRPRATCAAVTRSVVRRSNGS